MNRWMLHRQIHTSWLIAATSVSFVIGVAFSQTRQLTIFSSFVWMIAASLAIILVLLQRRVYLVPLAIVGGLIIGLWRGSAHTVELASLHGQIGRVITMTALIKEDVDTDASGQSILRLDGLRVNNQPLPGMIWVSTASSVAMQRSDRVTFSGKLSQGFGGFTATMYRANVVGVERPRPGDVALTFRDWFADAIKRSIASPESSLGIGYLVGQKRALPADLVEALQVAGLTHVVVASGYNLTILVRLARRLFMRISKFVAAASAGMMIICFVAITGLSPSMSRAGLVASLSLLAWYYGRKFHPLVLLSFAAAVTVMVNPGYMAGDLGWQLSFAAFAGVMIVAPLLHRYFFGNKKPGTVRQILGETIAALIVTAPILIGAFGQFSNIAVVANLLVLPLVPLAMLLTFIAGIGALIVPAYASVIGTPATWLLHYMISVAQGLSHIPWATSRISFAPYMVVSCYGVLILVCLYLWRATKYNLREVNLVE